MPDEVFVALLLLALLAAGLFLSHRFLVFANLCKERLRTGDWSPIPRSQAPAHTQRLFQTAEDALGILGFERLGCLGKVPDSAYATRLTSFADLYWHEAHAVIALVEHAPVGTNKAYSVRFLTPLRDGHTLLTLNRERHLYPPFPPELIPHDPYANSLTGQWEAHLQRLTQLPPEQAPETDRASALARSQDWAPSRHMTHWQHSGWVKPANTRQFRYSLRGAWRMAWRMTTPPAIARRAARRPFVETLAPDRRAITQAEMDAMATQLTLAAEPLSPGFKTAAFLLALLAGVAIFGSRLDFLSTAALMLALLIHESGHWLAMRALNYRNVSVFFLPFFGAATTGHKPNATPMQGALVSLAGPALGLLVTGAIVVIPAAWLPLPLLDFARKFVPISLALNLFNLLPFGILDGGRVFEQTVLGRFPYARVIFEALGMLGGIACALYFKHPLFGLVMAFLLLRLPLKFRTAGIVSRLMAKARRIGLRQFGSRQALRALAESLSDGHHHRPNRNAWRVRYAVAQLAYPRLLQGLPGLGVSLGGLSLLALSFAAPLALSVWVLLSGTTTPLWRTSPAEAQQIARHHQDLMAAFERSAAGQHAKAEIGTITARNAVEARVLTQWKMLEAHKRACLVEDGPPCEPGHLAWIESEHTALLKQLPPDHVESLRSRLMTDEGQPPAAKAAEAIAVAAILTHNDTLPLAELNAEQFALWVQAYERLVAFGSSAQLQAQENTANSLWSLISNGKAGSPELAIRFAELRARVAFGAGNPQEAEVWMQRYLGASRKSAENTGKAFLLEASQRIYGWFLLDIGNPEPVEQLAMRPHSNDLADAARWLSLAGWAAMAQGHPREADTLFVAAKSSIDAQHPTHRPTPPWWAQLFGLAEAPKRTNVDPLTLDHIAALQAYDPDAAQREIVKLPRQVKLPYFEGAPWGRARQTAHRDILAAVRRQPIAP